MQVFKVPQGLWYDEQELEIEFPDGWSVTLCEMAGEHRSPLTPAQIAGCFESPVGCAPLRELARGKRSAVILFDDITRPTRTRDLATMVLSELAHAGLDEESIHFVCATGCHRAQTRFDYEKKLGPDILRHFRVYGHNPFGNCDYVGETSRGTRLEINSEFLQADLKIGIGAILPHVLTGFSGGAKVVVPGAASIATVTSNHRLAGDIGGRDKLAGSVGLGRYRGNVMREDIEEAGKIVGLDFLANVLVNSRGKAVDLIVGEPTAVYEIGASRAESHYKSPRMDSPDVIVLNANVKGCQALNALWLAREIVDSPVDLVVISCCPEGQEIHYLLGSFGQSVGGPMWKPITTLPRWARRIVFYSPYVSRVDLDVFGPESGVSGATTWSEVLSILCDGYRDQGARVAIYPDATVQY